MKAIKDMVIFTGKCLLVVLNFLLVLYLGTKFIDLCCLILERI